MRFEVFLAVLQAVSAAGLSEPPSEVPYYGLSPPVYPSPPGSGSTDSRWAAAYRRARALVSQFTVEEKANVTQGFKGSCVGNTGTVARLGVPALCFADAPDGVRGQELVSAFPAGLHLAATFDRELMHAYGRALGEENAGKGVNVALGPVAGPMGRVARGGRNWESLGPDPYLSGAGMEGVVRGMQEAGVVATPKHFLLNEQEWRRQANVESDSDYDSSAPTGEALSSNVDDRALHELYAFPFMDALRAGAGSVMCSYQRANHSYGCQNAKLLNGVLKTELGFEGFVVSDWGAQKSGVASALAGLDVVMPDGGHWADGALVEAVRNGSVEAARLDDMATRLLAAWLYLDQRDRLPATNVQSPLTVGDPVDVQGDHAALIRRIGAAGTVLVKNEGALPLNSMVKMISVVGYDAPVAAGPWTQPDRYGGGYGVNDGWNTFAGTLVTGGGSGISTPPYIVSPFEAVRQRVADVRGSLRWDFSSENPTFYANSQACLVFINAYASESFDRASLTDASSDRLVRNVAANCTNTIVTIHHAGPRTVDAWVDHPNVTAVLFAGLPGQESGNSLVDVLWGDVNPSGKLPFTVARRESDYGDLLNATVTFDYFPETNFSEGLLTDYRHFDARGIDPLFEFGYGLSYTSFRYSGLEAAVDDDSDLFLAELPDPNVAIVQGGHPQLWDVVARVRATVANTGAVFGAEAAQLYVAVPDRNKGDPVRVLRGFQQVPLEPGRTGVAAFALTRRDLSVWDVEAQQWRLRRGTYRLYVGSSSRKLPLEGGITI